MAQKCKQNRLIKCYSVQEKSRAFAKKKGKDKHTLKESQGVPTNVWNIGGE